MDLDQLRLILSNTLSPNADTIRAAENQLNEAKKQPTHAIQVLHLVASSDNANAHIRQAAAVHFKNIVKKGWDIDSEDGTDGITISPNDRITIKSHLVELMCTVPPQIQAQCAEAISLIAKIDFPKNWDNLLPELVQRFSSPDPNVINGVLLTANSILKRFRYSQRCDALYADILYSLQHLQAPLLTLFKTTGSAIDAYVNDVSQLRPRFAALRSMCRIFYSLVYQDLPEYFEDHMSEWMTEFAKYLSYNNPLLVDEDEEDEASPVDVLQAAIVENLFLFADKDEESFIPFLPNFTTLVWNLLLGVTSYPKHDILATTCIKFLSSLVGKLMHRDLFKEEGTLKQIIAKIVIPNLMIREVDEERFEDDPQEFIAGDMEGEDTDSRRRKSQELLRAMCRQFQSETTAFCSEHIKSMLGEFASSPSNYWKSKDVAIHLMFGVSIKAESNLGVSAINENVNLMDFFTANILTELQESNHSVRPMVKATAIKFVSTFRRQFSKDHLKALLPLLINHLASPSVVVHTYSAAAIEKFLTCREEGEQQLLSGRNKITSEDIQPFLEPLFTGLFRIVEDTDMNENEYVMKCIMRALNTAGDSVVQVTQIVLEKLNAALFVVAKNPRNPQYNHYMFESIAVLVKNVCSKHPDFTTGFEGLLFPPFQTVLQMDVSEFTPYVFQILAQLLEYRPDEAGLGESYSMLLAPLLTPALWERKGNIPALTRLLQAYLKKGSSTIIANGQFLGLLGVFQKLVASRVNEVNAFDLLGAIIQYVPANTLQTHLKTVMQILLHRLQHGKSARYVRLFTAFLAHFIGKYGFQAVNSLFNDIQPDLFIQLLSQLWLPRLDSEPPIATEAKTQLIGLTKVVCDSLLLSDASRHQIWVKTLAACLSIISSPKSSFNSNNHLDDNEIDFEITYDASYSRLVFASRPPFDPFQADVSNPTGSFVTSFHSFYNANVSSIKPLLQVGLQSDPKLFGSLESMVQKAGLHLA